MKNAIRLLAIILVAGVTLQANGQVNLKDRLKKAANSAASVILNPDQKQEQPQQPQEPAQQVPEPEPVAEQAPAQPEQPQLQAYSKFDFIPGEKVIFYDDFSQDADGDFPALWNTNGSAEVVKTNLFEGKWMKFNTENAIWSDQLLALPDNYTIEFDVIPTSGDTERMSGFGFLLMQAKNQKSYDHGSVPGEAGFYFNVEYYGTPRYHTYINTEEGREMGQSGSKDDEASKLKINTKYHVSIWVQKARVRLYVNENKFFDLPRAFNVTGGVKMDRIRFESGAAMVSNVRIAVGAPDTRSKLITEGRLVSYGIYFDVNKDVVKPESYGTLKEIATALTENPGVRVKIIGHTDSDGADAANLDLSKRRAEAVKNELAKSFGIDASRFETEGAGESKPVAPNDTPVNKALNRRVEFVKL